MDKTRNYQLNQWAAGDKVQRIDFNADNAKIDAAIAAVSARADALGTSKADKTALSALQADLDAVRAAIPKIAVGSYAGDGAASRTIHLGFTPKAVLVISSDGRLNATYGYYGGLAVTGGPVAVKDNEVIALTATGFQVSHTTASHANYTEYFTANEKSKVYHYLAVK